MREPMTRRAFMKKLGDMALLGAGLTIGGSLITACVKQESNLLLANENNVGESTQLVYSNKGLGVYFYLILQEALNRAAHSKGWFFEASVADLDPVKQSKQFEYSVEKKPSAIIVNPVDSLKILPSLELASMMNIPVGIIDTPVAFGKADLTVSFDNFKAGEMAAHKIIDLLTAKYGTAKGVVINCYGNLNSNAWALRKQGFESVMMKSKHIQLVSYPTDGDIIKVHDFIVEALKEYPDLAAVHCPSEAPARGVYQALKEKGKLYPSDSPKHVIFVTIDGEPIAHEWIQEGVLDASISQDPIAYGEICVELLERYTLKGKPVPLGFYENHKYYWKRAEIVHSTSGPSVMIPPFEINRQNVNDSSLWGNIAHHDWAIQYM